ncbi:MAG: carboxymuconolactone decarboxylase family protein [Phycisphaeraceae bacterium]
MSSWNELSDPAKAQLESIAAELGLHQAPAVFWSLARVPSLLADHWANLRSTLIDDGPLEAKARASVAWAVSSMAPDPDLDAFLSERFQSTLTETERAEAAAVASICTTYNTLFKFRHMVEDEDFGKLRAGLRVKTFKETSLEPATVELISVAVSAINACQLCVGSHTKKARDLGLSPEQIDHAVKIAAVVGSLAQFARASASVDPVD